MSVVQTVSAEIRNTGYLSSLGSTATAILSGCGRVILYPISDDVIKTVIKGSVKIGVVTMPYFVACLPVFYLSRALAQKGLAHLEVHGKELRREWSYVESEYRRDLVIKELGKTLLGTAGLLVGTVGVFGSMAVAFMGMTTWNSTSLRAPFTTTTAGLNATSAANTTAGFNETVQAFLGPSANTTETVNQAILEAPRLVYTVHSGPICWPEEANLTQTEPFDLLPLPMCPADLPATTPLVFSPDATPGANEGGGVVGWLKSWL